MFRSRETRSIRYRVLLVGIAILLGVTAGTLARAPDNIDTPIPIKDTTDPFVTLLQMGPIEVPMPTSDSFVG